MDEKRQFFRIRNTGEIHAKAIDELEVIDISSSGVLVIKKNSKVPPQGIIELHILNFSINVSYEILRVEKKRMVLVFNKEDEISKLFLVLKTLRDEQNKNTPPLA